MRSYVPRALLAALLAVSAAACAASTAGTSDSGASGSRYRVLVPDLQGPEGSRVADELRELLEGMATHTSVSERDMRRAMGQYELEQLDQITARQLAQQVGYQNVLWGTIEQSGSGLTADAVFVDVASGEELPIENVQGAGPAELAQAIYAAVDRTVEGVRQAVFCNDYLSSQQFERALQTCDEALAIVPGSTRALYGKATALLNLERSEEALDLYTELLEIDPAHQDALLGAGLAASRLGRSERAMGFYNRYLEVDPGNVQVRMTVANDIAQTGDYESAFIVLEPAIAENAADLDFQKYLFAIATAAGQKVQQERGEAEARRFFESAMQAYQDAFVEGGAELDASTMRQAIAVNAAMGDQAAALRLAEQATVRFDTVPAIWSQYATVLSDAGRHQDAARALTRVVELDPQYENVYIRRAMARMAANDRQGALADLERAAQGGDRARVAEVLLSMASPALQNNRFSEAASLLEIAQNYAAGNTRNQVNFFLGYSLYRQGEATAKANTQGTAADAERALGFFRRALPLLQATNHSNAPQVLQAAQQYIENQEAIIRAARGR
jgi:tetratricopeptide (TPR) repeat protein